ncbi:MAG: hypothetical protein ACR2PL_25755 [Dehalococcoidia bacterium]
MSLTREAVAMVRRLDDATARGSVLTTTLHLLRGPDGITEVLALAEELE